MQYITPPRDNIPYKYDEMVNDLGWVAIKATEMMRRGLSLTDFPALRNGTNTIYA